MKLLKKLILVTTSISMPIAISSKCQNFVEKKLKEEKRLNDLVQNLTLNFHKKINKTIVEPDGSTSNKEIQIIDPHNVNQLLFEFSDLYSSITDEVDKDLFYINDLSNTKDEQKFLKDNKFKISKAYWFDEYDEKNIQHIGLSFRLESLNSIFKNNKVFSKRVYLKFPQILKQINNHEAFNDLKSFSTGINKKTFFNEKATYVFEYSRQSFNENVLEPKQANLNAKLHFKIINFTLNAIKNNSNFTDKERYELYWYLINYFQLIFNIEGKYKSFFNTEDKWNIHLPKYHEFITYISNMFNFGHILLNLKKALCSDINTLNSSITDFILKENTIFKFISEYNGKNFQALLHKINWLLFVDREWNFEKPFTQEAIDFIDTTRNQLIITTLLPLQSLATNLFTEDKDKFINTNINEENGLYTNYKKFWDHTIMTNKKMFEEDTKNNKDPRTTLIILERNNLLSNGKFNILSKEREKRINVLWREYKKHYPNDIILGQNHEYYFDHVIPNNTNAEDHFNKLMSYPNPFFAIQSPAEIILSHAHLHGLNREFQTWYYDILILRNGKVAKMVKFKDKNSINIEKLLQERI